MSYKLLLPSFLRKTVKAGFYLLCYVPVHAQVISQFTWDANPVTTAFVGPNAISAGSSATVSIGGKTGNGLNAGAPTMDINLTLTGSPAFDVPGVDISVDFLRKEAVASFYRRGSNIDFGLNGGNLYANFLVSDGAGGSIAVNSGNVYVVPSDNQYHNYRFIYYNVQGKAQILVDGAIVYNYTGVAGRPLYWTGAGNLVIGMLMDGSGSNVSILDNFIVQSPPNAVLPLQLLSFRVNTFNDHVLLDWSCTDEVNFDHFTIERSADGQHFDSLATVLSQPTGRVTSYRYTDPAPPGRKAAYRLKMVDRDGAFSYSFIATADVVGTVAMPSAEWYQGSRLVEFRVPVARKGLFTFSCFNASGQQLKSITQVLDAGPQRVILQMPPIPAGLLIVQIHDRAAGRKASFKLVAR